MLPTESLYGTFQSQVMGFAFRPWTWSPNFITSQHHWRSLNITLLEAYESPWFFSFRCFISTLTLFLEHLVPDTLNIIAFSSIRKQLVINDGSICQYVSMEYFRNLENPGTHYNPFFGRSQSTSFLEEQGGTSRYFAILEPWLPATFYFDKLQFAVGAVPVQFLMQRFWILSCFHSIFVRDRSNQIKFRDGLSRSSKNCIWSQEKAERGFNSRNKLTDSNFALHRESSYF